MSVYVSRYSFAIMNSSNEVWNLFFNNNANHSQLENWKWQIPLFLRLIFLKHHFAFFFFFFFHNFSKILFLFILSVYYSLGTSRDVLISFTHVESSLNIWVCPHFEKKKMSGLSSLRKIFLPCESLLRSLWSEIWVVSEYPYPPNGKWKMKIRLNRYFHDNLRM